MTNLREAGSGLAVAALVAIAATFLSLTYKASARLFAPLLGMALNFLAEESPAGRASSLPRPTCCAPTD